jgi:Clp amino terminal domain, pathogenicity island component
MATGQGRHRPSTARRRWRGGWSRAGSGPEHVLLALFDEPSAATEALEELGVTRDRVEEHARAIGRSDPPVPPSDPSRGQSPNPAWYKLTGCANGLALAAGRRWPGPGAPPARPGVRRAHRRAAAGRARLLPGSPAGGAGPPRRRRTRGRSARAPAHAWLPSDRGRPGRAPAGHRRPHRTASARVGVALGFNWLPGDPVEGQPRRARVGAEEGIDLHAALATARGQATPGE